MSIADSLVVSAFGISIVFVVLILLCLFLKIMSYATNTFFPDKKPVSDEKKDIIHAQVNDSEEDFSSGELKLIDVDEKTAAMIMAIVSDETKIPLSELRFISIKAI